MSRFAWMVAALFPAMLAAQSPEPLSTRELMGEILAHYAALSPYLADERKFAEASNRETVKRELTGLVVAARAAAGQHRLQGVTQSLTRQVLEEQLAAVLRAHQGGNAAYAHRMLGASLSLCMSCHAQLPGGRHAGAAPTTLQGSLEAAELTFVLRDYDRALDAYGALIAGFPGNGLNRRELELALRRRMAVYARIKRDPGAGIAAIRADLTNPRLPAYLRADAEGWVRAFERWQRVPPLDLQAAHDRAVLAFAREHLDESGEGAAADDGRRIDELWVSGVLYDYLAAHPNSPAASELLYWLAICDRGLSDNVFYSLADLYLKSCIRLDPARPIARRCLDEYERSRIAGYSGSSGTHLPGEVTAELESLRRLVGRR